MPLVEVGVDAAAGRDDELEERELGPSRLDLTASERLTLARSEDDRVVRGHFANLAELDRQHDDVRRVEPAVLGRVELVEVGILPAHVVGEAERREVEVEAARGGARVVVEAVDDVRRNDEERPRRKRARAVSEVEWRTPPRRRGTRRCARDGRASFAPRSPAP